MKSCLLSLHVLLALVATAAAQSEYAPAMSGPLNLFGQPDLSTYGSGPQPKQGWFFSFEGLLWNISSPDKTTIGREGFHPITFDGTHSLFQPNSLDNSFIDTDLEGGNRLEAGMMDRKGGWLVSAFQVQTNTHRTAANNVGVSFLPQLGPFGVLTLEGFSDPEGTGFDADFNLNRIFGRDGLDTGVPGMGGIVPGPPFDGIPDTSAPVDFGDLVYFPVFFDTLQVRNSVEVESVELMRVWRRPPGYHGALWEIFAGPRYLSFEEEFDVVGIGGLLADSDWNTQAENNIIGGQLGVRFKKTTHRYGFSTEARVLAAANFQNVRQRGQIGTMLQPGAPSNVGGPFIPRPLDLEPTSFQYTEHQTEFTPGGELRVQFHYQVTNAVVLRAGWTGVWIDGVARSSNMINYQTAGANSGRGGMGILAENNDQDVFMNGLTFGVEINR